MTNFSIIELDTVDSTNNYAMQLIDANKAQPGLTIVAQRQTAGKGQRGKAWIDEPGKNLLMSIIIDPCRAISRQFELNVSIAVVIANVLQKLYGEWRVAIKWPNDIIINDKKAGGILIENIIRGNQWTHSVIGLGLNINQDHFPCDLPFATSLKLESGCLFNIKSIRDGLREHILAAAISPQLADDSFKQYNELLYKRGCKQLFSDNSGKWEALILNALPDGMLEIEKEGKIVKYYHGQALWEWI